MDRPQHIDSGRTSGGRRLMRSALALLLAAALVPSLSGCQIVIGVMAIFKGFPKEDCDFKKQTTRTLNEKDKKVVILCSSESAARAELPSLDIDVIDELTRRFRVEKINVVDSHKVASWIDDNGGITDATDLTEIGPQFNADFIVLIKFEDFGFKEENSPSLYRGHARGTVVVVEMKPSPKGRRSSAKTIYHRPFDSKFPVNQPISAEQESAGVFKQRYLMRLSEELARLFYDHRPGDDM